MFAGSAGTVTVDGTQVFDTLQFKTDEYAVTGGSLAIGPASGAAGTFNIDNGVTTTVASVIAGGSGNALTKVGGGQLLLTGANTYTGLTTVLGGKLVVGDSGHASARLAGGVNVDNGGTLGGIGMVGDTTIGLGGTLAPGNSIGTINVAGLWSGGRYSHAGAGLRRDG